MAERAADGAHGHHRVIFVDLGRFLALVFMLYGHTVSALLAPDYQRGAWFEVWQFQRGLTSSLFLLLSGFSFSVATSRHWGAHQRLSPAFLRRTRRFGLFILLGYALHFPVRRFSMLATATAEQWRSFLAVDVLQLIGVTFLFVQALVLLTRSRRAFMVATLALAAAVVAGTHAVWAVPWGERVPGVLAAYLSTAGGSLFPLFPWTAYVLVGAGLGQLFVTREAGRLPRYATLVLLVPGALLATAGALLMARDGAPWSADPWNFIPLQVTVRLGSCMVLLALIAYASLRIRRLPRFFAAVAQETLLIYFVHLCIVYGSVWAPGLSRWFGASLDPLSTAVCVVLLLASMAALGWTWHGVKHTRPRLARWMTATAAALLVARLI